MELIFITIPITLVLIAVAIKIFFWASKSGQFDDLEGPAHSILFDVDIKKTVTKPTTKQQDNEQSLD
jgi:cbb3-type cytochrome oxidase maturation protein